MCVCPHTTIGASTPSTIARSRASGVRAVKISFSSRGVPWQNSTSPTPSTRRATVFGQRAIASPQAAPIRSPFHAASGWKAGGIADGVFPAIASSTATSQLPTMYSTGTPHDVSRSSTSRGIGPMMTSPPATIRSTFAARTSSSTASSAGRLPWMSFRTATRMPPP